MEARDTCWSAPVALQQSIELVRDAITPGISFSSNGDSNTCIQVLYPPIHSFIVVKLILSLIIIYQNQLIFVDINPSINFIADGIATKEISCGRSRWPRFEFNRAPSTESSSTFLNSSGKPGYKISNSLAVFFPYKTFLTIS